MYATSASFAVGECAPGWLRGFLCWVARLIGRGAQSSTDWFGHLVRMSPWGGPGMSSWEKSPKQIQDTLEGGGWSSVSETKLEDEGEVGSGLSAPKTTDEYGKTAVVSSHKVTKEIKMASASY